MTKVQGMPKSAEKKIAKMTRDFIWNEKQPMVSAEQLSNEIENGGIKLLDVKARNDAIEIMWLKPYLNLNKDRPTWAYVMDVLIGQNITKNSGQVHKLSQFNIFLQSWKVNSTGTSRLPEDVKRMLKVGKKYHLTCNAIKLSRKMK